MQPSGPKSFAAAPGTPQLIIAAWPSAAGATRRTGSASRGSVRPADSSLHPAMNKTSQSRTGAEPRDRSVREGGTTDRKRKRVRDASPSPPAPEPCRMIAGARLCRWWSIPSLGGPHKERGCYAFAPQFEQTLASTTIGTSG